MAIVSRKYPFYGRKKQLISHVLFTSCFILQSLWMPIAQAADSDGQKAHFQVEDKSGEMKITATKDQAKVIAQADSVQVVVKPGTADYPVLKSDKPIVHVTQPGWSSISIRKSAIFEGKNPLTKGKKNFTVATKPRKTLVIGKRLHSKNEETSMSIQKLQHVFLREGCSFLPKKQRKCSERKSTQHEAKNVSGSKKSDVKYGGFHVSGNAGKLKMHVTKDETTLSSESGGVDISLNKHPSSSTTSDQRKLNTQPEMYREESADKAVHIASELENSLSNFSGLRKSVVTELKKDWDRYNNRRL